MFSPDPLAQRPYHPDSVTSRIRKVARRYRLRNVTPHQLRHYAATKLAPYLTATEMMGWLGWKTESMVSSGTPTTAARATARIMGAELAKVLPLAGRRRRRAV